MIVLHILLLLLKIIGILLLILLGLILVVLFVPIRYSFEGEYHKGEMPRAMVRITWFVKLLHIQGSFEDKKLSYHAKVAWKTLLSSEKKSESESGKSKKKKDKPAEAAQPIQKDEAALPDQKDKPETSAVQLDQKDEAEATAALPDQKDKPETSVVQLDQKDEADMTSAQSVKRELVVIKKEAAESEQTLSAKAYVEDKTGKTESEARIEEPKDNKTGEIASKDDKVGDKVSKDDKTGEIASKDDKVGEIAPKDDKTGEIAPKDDKTGEIAPKDDKTGDKVSKDDKSEKKKSKDDKSEKKKSKDDKAEKKKSKDDKAGKKKLKDDKSGKKKSKEDKAGKKKSKDDKAGKKKSKDDKAGKKKSKDKKSDHKKSDQKLKDQGSDSDSEGDQKGIADKITGKIEQIRELYKEYRVGELIPFVKDILISVIKHILPRKLSGHLSYGFDDPATTGKITAAAAVFYPAYADTFALYPDFTEECLDTECKGSGRIRLGFFVWILIRLLLNKHVRHDIVLILKR